ncbi:unnamed protein product [Clonostachys rosea f. rosea IK726]|uniref:Uncharacterized protein n=1 Tax=Clonostachys rosea f. rosea IK726 TaxID=1349383 RepID=A0ACA9TCD8_BIOOC|nr:unnamed protein product [Clonostachys rosea f. rosea IK726]
MLMRINESGSEGLGELIDEETKKFFTDVDTKPCLTHGLRAFNYYSVGVSGPDADLHSGVFSGETQEHMTSLIRVLSSLIHTDGCFSFLGRGGPLHWYLYKYISFVVKGTFSSLNTKTIVPTNVIRKCFT